MQVTLLAKPMFVYSDVTLDAFESTREDQLCGTDAEDLIEYAGRICYDSFSGKGRSSRDYAAHILEVDHGSVLEHAQFTFLIQGVSRCLTHELIRHRVGTAISQRSTRYCDESEVRFVRHAAESGTSAAQSATREHARGAYQQTVDRIEEQLVERGVSKLSARKQARAAAARYLPQGLETELVWSANIRALRHVILMRAHDAADAEIRELGVQILKVVRPHVPAYLADLELAPAEDGLGHVVRRVT
jgi:thymidylate synthase (FAD)